MTLSELLEKIHATRAVWETALEKAGVARMEEPLLGEWSIKDMIVHINWSEVEMVNMLHARSLAFASPLWELGNDERNQRVFEQNKTRTLNEVTAEEKATYTALMAEIAKLSDTDLNDPAHFAGMPAEWIPWQILAGSTYRHYEDHARDIENNL